MNVNYDANSDTFGVGFFEKKSKIAHNMVIMIIHETIVTQCVTKLSSF